MGYEIGQTCMLVNMGLSRSECASWVQAWGSPLTVAGAALGIWWQVRKQAEQRAEDLRRIEDEREKARVAEEVRRLLAIANIFFQCIVILRRMEVASGQRLVTEIELEMQSLGRLADLLASIPVLDVPDRFVAYAIAEARSIYTTLKSGMTKAAASTAIMLNVPVEDQPHARRSPHMARAARNFLELEQTMKRSLQDRGSDLPEQTVLLNDGVLHTTRPRS